MNKLLSRFQRLCLSLLTGMMSAGLIHAQCETCTPDLTCVAVDFPILCPSQLPNGVQGEYYESTATFNLPPSVVDPGSGIEAQLLTVTIASVTGLPFGLELTPNNPDGVYQPQDGEFYGCTIVCGTPLVSGSFFVDINVSVLVSAFGFQQTVNESFSLPLTIDPGANAGTPTSFEVNATQGCAPMNGQGTNLIEGPGASYFWDFGNGTTSTAMNPSFVLDSVGAYEVSCQTTVTELSLSQVSITALGGGWGQDIEDIFGQPDPYFVLSGPEGEIYTAAYANNNATPTFGGLSISLESGVVYNIAFYDSDGILTADDFLGSSDFIPTQAGVIVVSNSTTASLTIQENVVATFDESLVVTVFESLDGFADLDGDGYGDPNVPIDGCDLEGTLPFSFNDQDCNDNNANVYFGAPGSGEGIDNNCDGQIIEDEIIVIPGCTEPTATNFNPEANQDDGSCIIPACLGDLNNDLTVSVADILIMLGSFGCSSSCEDDLNNDDTVGVGDLLALLANFGIDCE
jgi:PKD repeat protein